MGNSNNWKTAACGQHHSVAIKKDGTLWSWGSNNNGGLGLGSPGNKRVPQQIGSATDWIAVTAGMAHTMAMNTSNAVFAWGANSYGELGIGNRMGQAVPVQVK